MATLTQQWSGAMKMNHGKNIPSVGFGTYRIHSPEVIMTVVDEALSAGYRLFDTAAVYGNESMLQRAFKTFLPKYGLEREDIFITTKLSPSDHGPIDSVRQAYDKSLQNLGLDFADLYLIHFPGASRVKTQDPRNQQLRDDAWEALTTLYDEGRVKAVGVSNYTVRHLRQLMDNNHGVVPAVNQVELHPYYTQDELVKFCKENQIVVQAYSSLGSHSSDKVLLEDPRIRKIAAKLNVGPAQVLLGWALQKDIAVIPRSTNPAHIRSNIDLSFRISDEDMNVLNNLGVNTKFAWDPTNVY